MKTTRLSTGDLVAYFVNPLCPPDIVYIFDAQNFKSIMVGEWAPHNIKLENEPDIVLVAASVRALEASMEKFEKDGCVPI